MTVARRSARPPGDDTGPALLPTFFAGTLAMVLAVVVIARIDNDWADLVAVLLLVIAAGVVLLAIGRRLRDDDEHTDDGRPQ